MSPRAPTYRAPAKEAAPLIRRLGRREGGIAAAARLYSSAYGGKQATVERLFWRVVGEDPHQRTVSTDLIDRLETLL